ncbi:hypothetical protein PHYPSEUDO_010699 [Phytophthora pseudosyringae]|uniref:Uncharacterized protein n=1 Tax=Phytophthora pseudosyringae TaxID=221518 RepID=A0A8T1VAH0_9STRA|nr:hypothetical protein PHYPSEUDO_010699 [Phytophthora pseudosyringae]
MNLNSIPIEDLDAVAEVLAFMKALDAAAPDLDVLHQNIPAQSNPRSTSKWPVNSSCEGAKRKRKSNPPQRGKKDKIEALRHQVEELEFHVKHLKKLRPDTEVLSHEDKEAQSKGWRAEIEQGKLQRSEETNRKLRSIISRQQSWILGSAGSWRGRH